jgi:hypothetical protein
VVAADVHGHGGEFAATPRAGGGSRCTSGLPWEEPGQPDDTE